MKGIFLQTLGEIEKNISNFESVTSNDPSLFFGLAGLTFFILGLLFFIFVLIVGLYVYTSFAYMKIGQKTKDKSPGIAWIPIVGKPLLASRIAGMHWWPILLLATFILLPFPFLGIFIFWICSLVFTVFFYIWRWKMFEEVNYPGWFALFFLIFPVGHILLGIAAWGKEGEIEPVRKKSNKKNIKKKSSKKKK